VKELWRDSKRRGFGGPLTDMKPTNLDVLRPSFSTLKNIHLGVKGNLELKY